MAAASARDFVIKKGGTVIAGLQTTGASLDGSPVDITSKEDNGFRTLATFAGMKALDLTGEGVVKDAVIQDLAFDPDASLLFTDVTLEFADGAVIAGDFYLASNERTGEHNGEERYSLSLQSSEAWTYTAAA